MIKKVTTASQRPASKHDMNTADNRACVILLLKNCRTRSIDLIEKSIKSTSVAYTGTHEYWR